jgi:hypothetical protein
MPSSDTCEGLVIPLSHFLRSQWKFREQKELPLSLSGRMLLQPLEQQQKRLCLEAHPLLLRGAPEKTRMELQQRRNLGQLQSPQNGFPLSSRTSRVSGR